jgi:hypothetical protein
MARNTVKISQVINDFLITLDHDDYANDTTHASVRVIALRGLREMGFDILKRVKSIKLPVNQTNSTVDLPDDFVDLVKIGSVGSDGLVYVMGENKNINYSQKYLEQNGVLIDSDGDGIYDRVDSKSATSGGSTPGMYDVTDDFDDYVFRNYIYNNESGRLYGVGGGQYLGQYRINLDQNRIEVDTHNGAEEVVIEYIADEARSSDPSVHIYAEEALRAYIYYKLIERKASVPYNEKARARQEYYNEYRRANARLKSFSKEEALKTIRKNYKQAPKG